MFRSISSHIFIFLGFASLLVGGGVFFSFSNQSQADGMQQKILTLEKIIELPSSPAVAAWNAGGTKMLVNIPYIYRKPYHSVVRIIDINTGTIGKPIGALGSLWGAKLHWSPKGDYLLVDRGGWSILFRYPSLKKLGVVKSSDTGVEGASSRCNFSRAIFSPDNKAIWVGCRGPGRSGVNKKNWVVAVKVSVPEMKIIKRVTLPVPQEGTAKFIGSGYVFLQNKKIILSMSAKVQAVPRVILKDTASGFKMERYHASYDLEAGLFLVKPFKRSDLSFRGFGGLAYSMRNNFLITNIHVDKNGKIVSRKIATINPKTLKPMSVFDALNELGATRLYRPSLFQDERFLFSRFSRADKATFLAIWNTKSLALQQVLKVPKFKWLKLSPDGKRLAGLSSKKLYIYKISQ